MQKFLMMLLTPIIENVFKKLFNKMMAEINEIKQVKKDKTFLKELRKETNARERAKRIKHFIDN